jgi:hypothetical protein
MFRCHRAGGGLVSADFIRDIRITAGMGLGWDLAGGTAHTGLAILSGVALDTALDITVAGPDMDITAAEVFRAGVMARI